MEEYKYLHDLRIFIIGKRVDKWTVRPLDSKPYRYYKAAEKARQKWVDLSGDEDIKIFEAVKFMETREVLS